MWQRGAASGSGSGSSLVMLGQPWGVVGAHRALHSVSPAPFLALMVSDQVSDLHSSLSLATHSPIQPARLGLSEVCLLGALCWLLTHSLAALLSTSHSVSQGCLAGGVERGAKGWPAAMRDTERERKSIASSQNGHGFPQCIIHLRSFSLSLCTVLYMWLEQRRAEQLSNIQVD